MGGGWLLYLPEGKSEVLSDDAFRARFEPAEHADLKHWTPRALPPGRGVKAAKNGRRAPAGTGKFACGQCHRRFASSTALGIHVGRSHKPHRGAPAKPVAKPRAGAGVLRCPDCGERFKNGAGLGSHRSRVHGVKGGSRAPKPTRRAAAHSATKGRATIPPSECPSCQRQTTLNPCAHCHTQIAPGAIANAG